MVSLIIPVFELQCVRVATGSDLLYIRSTSCIKFKNGSYSTLRDITAHIINSKVRERPRAPITGWARSRNFCPCSAHRNGLTEPD